MNKFQEKLESILLPMGDWANRNWILTILRDSFIAVMPLTIVGSVSLIIAYFPFIEYILPADILNGIISFFEQVNNATLGLIAIFLVGAIGYYYSKLKDNNPLYGMIVSICSFLVITPMGWNEELAYGFLPTTWLGGQGLFVAIVVGFTCGAIYNRFVKSKFTIKMPDSVPPNIMEPFKVLIPAFVTFVVFAAVRYVLTFTAWGDIHTLFFELFQTPLMKLGTSLPTSIICVIVIQLCWFVGLHGQNIVYSVMSPIWIAAMVSNMEAVSAGNAPQYIFTEQFFNNFVFMSFSSLVIACLLAKSSQLKSVGKLSVGAAIFNISEPIVFGSPIVLNFLLLIPWILVMVLYVIITWGFMKTGLCPLPLGTNIPWTTPPIISGWLITGSPMGAVVQIICLIVGTFVYLPFVKMYDKQLLKAENKTEELIEE